LVAVATGHEHWLKERDDVIPVTGPLNAWIDQLPAKTLKKLERNLAPTLFVVGLATVVGPDIVLEMRLRALAKNASRPIPRSPGQGQGAYPPAGRDAGPVNGAVPEAGGEADRRWSIPAGSPGIAEWDV